MSNYNSLKTIIDANIKRNGRQEITGQILNSVLNQMVSTLGVGYQFVGVATTATNPGTPDARVFYIATEKGTYPNFGGIQVTEDEVVVLCWESTWNKVLTGIYTKNGVDSALAQKANDDAVVHKTGDEDISGMKNFKDGVFLLDGELLLDSFSDDGNGMQSVTDLYLSSEFEHIHLHDYDRDADEERDIDDLIGTIFSKADSSNVYTKTEVDDLLSDVAHGSDLQDLEDYVNRDFAKKANTYTKTEVDGKLAEKANQDDVDDAFEYDHVRITALEDEMPAKANTTDLTALSGRVDSIESVVGDVNELLETI